MASGLLIGFSPPPHLCAKFQSSRAYHHHHTRIGKVSTNGVSGRPVHFEGVCSIVPLLTWAKHPEVNVAVNQAWHMNEVIGTCKCGIFIREIEEKRKIMLAGESEDEA